MTEQWNSAIRQFISLANNHKVTMLMVGGGAVNFHGYQRHSADVDFWIESFQSAYDAAEGLVIAEEDSVLRWQVLSLDDLITSKIKAGRPKDLLDIQELRKNQNI